MFLQEGFRSSRPGHIDRSYPVLLCTYPLEDFQAVTGYVSVSTLKIK